MKKNLLLMVFGVLLFCSGAFAQQGLRFHYLADDNYGGVTIKVKYHATCFIPGEPFGRNAVITKELSMLYAGDDTELGLTSLDCQSPKIENIEITITPNLPSTSFKFNLPYNITSEFTSLVSTHPCYSGMNYWVVTPLGMTADGFYNYTIDIQCR